MPATPKSAMRTRAQDRARQARVDAKARKACVEAVWARAGGKCERCSERLELVYDGGPWWRYGHVHEVTPRSLGGDPTNPDTALLLCVKCHGQAHGLRFGSTV